MRLTLLLICLFSLLGGCAASSSHGVVVPKTVYGFGKQQVVAAGHRQSFEQTVVTADANASCFDKEDMEDDDDHAYLSFRKFRSFIRYAAAYTHSVTLHSLRRCRLSVAEIHGNASPKYLTQSVLRV